MNAEDQRRVVVIREEALADLIDRVAARVLDGLAIAAAAGQGTQRRAAGLLRRAELLARGIVA